MRLFLIIFIGMALGYTSPALSEQGCPDGLMPNPVWTQGQPQCIPGKSQNWGSFDPPPAPQQVWAKRWGAFARDSSEGVVGISSEEKSKRRAAKAAVNHCKSKGGKNCVLILEYDNQCAAIVSGGGRVSWASAPTENEAEKNSVTMCEKNSGVKCDVFYSGCSYAELVQ